MYSTSETHFYGRAEEIVAKLNERTNCKVTLHDFSDPEVLRASIADSAILVNGTSVGMAPKTENTIITDTTMFHKDLFVFRCNLQSAGDTPSARGKRSWM